jgi:tetratricopeptide (TPR) repeat protein
MKMFDLKSEIYLSEYRKKIFVFITLFIIILSIYSNTFQAPWHFDDTSNIVENSALHLTKFSWPNIKKTFFAKPRPPGELYRPVACLSFALNYYFGKDNVSGYHIVNISIHFLAAIFLFLFIYHTLNLPLLKAKYGSNSYFIALLSAALWAINPIQSQAITYIVQRMASMAGMFYIISMYLYVKGRTATHNHTKITFFLLCGISAILAFGSKENAIMLPVSLFLYDFLLIQGVSRETTKKNLKILLVAAVLSISIVIMYFAFSEATFSSLFGLYERRPFTLWERLIAQPRIIIFYISLLLYPMSTRLCVEHDIAISNSLFDPPTTIIYIIVIIGILIGAIFITKRKPLIAFSVLFFFLNHIIESTILPLELIFEHRNYIPSMLFFVPIAIGLINALSYFSYKRSMQVIIALSIVLVIIGEGHATFMRNFTWSSEESLWIDCTEKYPHLIRAHHNLGLYYTTHNQEEKAIDEYEKALESKAIHTIEEKSITYSNLGLIYFQKKEYEKAKRYYLQAIEINPCCRGTHNNLAVLLATTTKDFKEVLTELKKAITCNPASMNAYSNMGILLIKMGKTDEGIVNLKKALEIEPNYVPTLERLGYAYMKKGRLGTSFIYFKRTLNQRPKNIRAFLYLAEIYVFSGHKQKAQKSLSQFVDIIQYKDLVSLLDNFLGIESLLNISPDMSTILPLLSKAYGEKGASLQKNIDYYLNKMKNDTHYKKKKIR